MARFYVVAALCLLLNCALGWNPDEFIEAVHMSQDEKASGVHWAVLVAGSSGWDNYRHQADACHAYQIMRNNGIPEERIITMMYDDIAKNEENPTPGIVINHPNGSDVYHGVKIDYKGEDVTPENFIAVLKGDQAATNGGNGKVLKSGPKDHVFINFVDHGAPGILAFPSSELKASTLMAAIRYMYENKMYKQAVFYVEACESGSMFANLLSPNISVYATTAANPRESSYACYYDKERDTYLGDVYSVKWMEDTDSEDIKKETLHDQFKIVKEETNTSHVKQYGDTSISKESVADFQGGAKSKPSTPFKLPSAPLDAVRSEDVPLAILQHRLTDSQDEAEKYDIIKEMKAILELHRRINDTMKHIVGKSADTFEQASRVLTTRHDLLDLECYESVVDDFDEKCFDLSKNDYAMRKLYALVNLCEEGIPPSRIRDAIHKTCIEDRLFE